MNENYDDLVSSFSAHEVETAADILECLKGPPTPSLFRRMLLLLLRGHYADASNFPDAFKHLECYTWSPGEDSPISIEFTNLDDFGRDITRPGIFVAFGGVKMDKSGVADLAGVSNDTATEYVSKIATISFSIYHCFKNAQDSYDAADMTASLVTAFGPAMVAKMDGLGCDVVGISEPKKEIPSPDRYYTVATGVSISYNRSVARMIESHRVRRIINLVAQRTNEP